MPSQASCTALARMAQGPLPRVTAHSPACGASAARSSAQAMSGRATKMAAAQARTRSQRRRTKEAGAGMSEAGSGCGGGVRGRFKVCARAQKAWVVLGGAAVLQTVRLVCALQPMPIRGPSLLNLIIQMVTVKPF